jgi:predicted secreted protein
MVLRSLFAVALCASVAAVAQPRSEQPFFNVVTLDASATMEVPTDTLTITLFSEEQGPDPAELASRINARLEQALATAKATPGVEARSGHYQTFPVYDRANQISGWRVRAEMVIESRDFKAAGTLAGRLQPALKLGSMLFSLSRGAREKVTAALLTEALAKYQAKAQVIAKTLGFPGYTLGQINVHSEGSVPPPQPMPRVMAMAADASAGPVPTEGGKNAVTVTVSGSVVLGPGR